ncbi:Crp/Fnr family transcriptional regulator [Pelagibacterium montanilacus]|uniref:Crp/Fnr family transcriptional regulator n=1 Tax=Pelagibacterium montanilacus TaxID=2185280 RepID=UPI003CCC4FD5
MSPTLQAPLILPQSCRECPALHNGMCSTLDQRQMLALSKHAQTFTLKAGTMLAGERQDTHSYASVRDGVIKLSRMLEDGRQQIVGLQFPSDFVGQIFAGQSSLTVTAASDIEICRRWCPWRWCRF